MDDEADFPHGRAAGFGLAVGLTLFIPLHFALDRAGDVALVLTLIGTLIAGLLSYRFAFARQSRPSRHAVAVFGVVLAVAGLIVAVLPPGALTPTAQAPPQADPAAEVAPGQRGGLLPDASVALDNALELARVDFSDADANVQQILVTNVSVLLVIYDRPAGLLRAYSATPEKATASSMSSAIDATVVTFTMGELNLGDINTLFDNTRTQYDLDQTASDSLSVLGTTTGQPPSLTITIGQQTDNPHTIELSANGDIPAPVDVSDATVIVSAVQELLLTAGKTSIDPVITEIVTQSAGRWQTPIIPIIDTPLGTETGVLIRLTTSPATILRTLGSQPTTVDDAPSGGTGFALTDISVEMLAEIIDEAAKPFTLTGDDMATVALRIAQREVDGSVKPVVELQFSSTPDSYATYTLDGQRLEE